MGEWKITYDYILERNNDLTELVRFCDSIRKVDNRIMSNMATMINTQRDLLVNKDLEIEQWEGKFGTAEDQVKIERRKRRLYQVTTGLSLGLAVFLGVLVIK